MSAAPAPVPPPFKFKIGDHVVSLVNFPGANGTLTINTRAQVTNRQLSKDHNINYYTVSCTQVDEHGTSTDLEFPAVPEQALRRAT